MCHRHQFHKLQFSYQLIKSTKSVLNFLTYTHENTLENKEISVSAFIDIKTLRIHYQSTRGETNRLNFDNSNPVKVWEQIIIVAEEDESVIVIAGKRLVPRSCFVASIVVLGY